MNRYLLQLMLAGCITAFAYCQMTAFRGATNLVLTPVWVGDGGGISIRNLKLEDFDIEENGIKVGAVRLGEPGEAPLELAMLFDMSGSVVPQFDLERQAAIRFLKRIMRPDDSVFLLSVANAPKILQDRTSSLDVALQAIAKILPTTQATAFHNSIAKAAHMLQAEDRPESRRVIIALSDGEDNRGVENEPKDVLRELQAANCFFYSINPKGLTYKTGFLGRRAQERMEVFAKQTGGAAFVADKVEELAEFYDRIADELQNQYLLGYNSPATSGAGIYRKIVIKVRGRPDLQVKARPGYYPN